MLPVELWEHIVLLLAESQPRCYGYAHEVLQTLCQLCYVSKTLERIATTHLYSSVSLWSPAQVILFNETVSALNFGKRVNALQISYAPGQKILVENDTEALAKLLSSLQSSLIRVLLDVNLGGAIYSDERTASSIIGAAVAALDLHEYACIQRDDAHVARGLWMDCVPCWPNLRRLALLNPYLTEFAGAGAAALPALTHTVLHIPAFSFPTAVGDLTAIYRKGGTPLRAFVWVQCDPPSLADRVHDMLRTSARNAPNGTKVVLCAHARNQEHVQAWLRARVEDGTIWDCEQIGNSEDVSVSLIM